MDAKKILFALLVSALMIGGVFAASVNDFTVDGAYTSEYTSEYYNVFTKDNQTCGILVFKNVDDDAYDDAVNDDILDNVIHHDGKEYTLPDDDMKIDKNQDNTANFTDTEHATHGISEVVDSNGQQYIVVFWAKDSSGINTTDIVSQLNDFNKENSVEPVAF